jgi:protein TonB
MGGMLFQASLVPARPRVAGAFPLSIGAHALGLAALLSVPLVAGGAPTPVGLPQPRPVVFTIPAPPPDAPPLPPRVVSLRPRHGGAQAASAPAAAPTRLVPLGDAPPLPVGDDPGVCSGCTLSTSASVGDAAAGGGPPGPTPGGGGDGTGSAPLVVGGHVLPPLKLRHVDPAYPDLARRAGVQGVVLIDCLIDREGRVAEARVVRGVPLLDGPRWRRSGSGGTAPPSSTAWRCRS